LGRFSAEGGPEGPGQGQLRWPRGAQSAPLNKIKIRKNQTSLIFPDFSLVLFARELAWRP
jgi:hypothetical protein